VGAAERDVPERTAHAPGYSVIGCEPAQANDAYLSLKTGELQPLESSDTIADGLRAPLAPRTFAILRRELAGVLLVSETEIIGRCGCCGSG